MNTVYNKYLTMFKTEYMLYIPLSIIFQSCLGSIAAMYILENHVPSFSFFQLGLCVVVSMLYNASVLAQLNSKLVFNLLLLTITVNTLLLILNY